MAGTASDSIPPNEALKETAMDIETAAQFVFAVLAFGTMYVLFLKDTM